MMPDVSSIFSALIDWLKWSDIGSLFILAFALHSVSVMAVGISRSRVLAVRCGIGVFTLWLAIAVSTGGLNDPDHLLAISMRGMLIAVTATGCLTLLFSLLESIRGWILNLLIRPVQRWSDRRAARQRQRQEAKRLRAEEQRRLEDQRRAAPQQRQAAELARRQDAIAHAEQLHRDQVRFDVRLFYDRYRRELADLLPEDKVDAYFQSFLTDSTDADVFAQRAERLKDMIRERLELSSRKQQAGFETIDEVIAHYDEKRRVISQLPVDAEVREDFLMQLDESMERDLREFL